MTKNVAIFKDPPLKVLNVLLNIGLKTSNPNGGYVGAFLNNGEQVKIESHEVPSFFLHGLGGVSLWLEGDHDFFIWCSKNYSAGSFDGFTPKDEASFLKKLRQSGLTISVTHEDDL